MLAVLAFAAALARPGFGESEFLMNLHKAETRKEPEERVEYLDRALKAWDPDEGNELLSHADLMRGEAHYELNELSDAEPDLSKAVELDPGSARAYFLRGEIRLKQGRPKDAEADLREYAAQKPDDIEGWLALADAQVRAREYADALESVRRADLLDPADWRVGLARARAAMTRKSWDSAVESLDAADVAAKRREPEVQAERAICRVAQGKPELALKDYGLALTAYEQRLDALARSKPLKIDAVETQGKAARAYFGRGRVYEFLGRTAPAAADYRESCRLGHEPACARERNLPADSAKKAKPETHDSGDRIYAN